MDARRRTWLAAIAFVLGLGLGAILVGGTPSARTLLGGPDVPIAVVVLNVGTHAALVQVSVDTLEGNAAGSTEFLLGPGAQRHHTYTSGSGRFLATVEASWTGAGTDGGRGTTREDGDADACGADKTLLFTFHVDTTRGVSFPRAASDCA